MNILKPKLPGFLIAGTHSSVGKSSAKEAIAAVLSAPKGRDLASGGEYRVRKSIKSYNSELGLALAILGLKTAWKNPDGFCGDPEEGCHELPQTGAGTHASHDGVERRHHVISEVSAHGSTSCRDVLNGRKMKARYELNATRYSNPRRRQQSCGGRSRSQGR